MTSCEKNEITVGARGAVIVTPKASDDNWQHRADGMRCRTCMAFARKQGKVGRCRARPPTLRGFPVVFEDDWCLGHKLDEVAFNEAEAKRSREIADQLVAQYRPPFFGGKDETSS
jgi:hypothetical protein